MSPLLARLAVGPGTKATYCPGPKGCRDKWPGTKACSVVVAGTLDGDPIYYQELKLIQPWIAKGVSRLIINLCSSGFPVEILFF